MNLIREFVFCYALLIYSKYERVIPLKDKKGITNTNTFQKILDESDRQPNKIWVGRYNKNMYINKLDYIINKYNNIYHITIKMKPVDVKSSTYIDFDKRNKKENPKVKVLL